jgi:hypothetical protein
VADQRTSKERNQIQADIIESALDRARILLSIVLDLALLGAWFALLWLFDLTFGSLEHQFNEWDIRTGKAFFAVSVLLAIAVIIYWDLRTIYRRLHVRYNDGK